MTIALANLSIALKNPMKQSKKKLKYKNTLNARKLFMASIFEFLLRNMNSDAILFMMNFNIKAIITGTSFRHQPRILDEKKKRTNTITKPISHRNKHM